MNAPTRVSVVQQAVTWLITYHPFYASIILKRDLIVNNKIPTACVNGHGQIWYNEEWLTSMGVKPAAFVLAHECMHYMMGHCVRRGARDPYWWNHWGDAVINEMQLASNAMYPNRMAGHFVMPTYPADHPMAGRAMGIRHPGAENMSVEELYASQPNEEQDKPQAGEGCGGFGEDLMDTPMDEGQAAELEAQLHVELQQATESAKRMGKLPESIARLVDSLKQVKTPWFEKMSQFFSAASQNDYSYACLDRRQIATGMYLPWFTGEGMGTVCIIIDVSGSISDTELEHFSHHLNKILDTCTPEKLVAIYVHTRVCKVDEFTRDDYPVMLSCNDSGGTDMTAGIDYVCENHADADCIAVLTDGYTPFGNDCGIPTFWAITSDKRSPWGETVKLEMDQ